MAKAKKPARKPARAKSTALARVQVSRPAMMRVRVNDPSRLLPEVIDEPAANMLGDNAATGALGLVEIKLTKKEELILSEPVNAADVLVKPTGQPYIPHAKYTRWFNRAFGRLGWSIVQKSKPMKQQRERSMTVSAYYMLYIHGQPAALALGEAEYHENNPEQTYGDALEATVAYALRRCAKRLGVGLEMWEQQFLESFLALHCVKVFVSVDGRKKPAWRLKSSPAFWNETGPADDRKPPSGSSGESEVIDATPARTSPSGTHAKSGEVITERQEKRMWAIAKSAGRKGPDVLAWLREMGMVVDASDGERITVLRRDYDAVVAAIEQPGQLQRIR